MKRKSQIKVADLGRFLIYILAHRPDEFGLVPDKEGFLPLKELLQGLHEEPGWGYVREGHVRDVLIGRDRDLFVWDRDHIRAVQKKWNLDLETPSADVPKILFAPIRRRAHLHVMEKGLFSYRPIVLSPDRDMALRIGRRQDRNPVLLEIMTGPAQEEGLCFYAFGDLFLTKGIPPKYIFGPPAPEALREPRLPGKEKPQKKEPVPSPGTFLLNPFRDPDLSRRRNGRKERGWKEASRKMRRNKG